MPALMRAELLALRTIRTPWLLLGVAVLVTVATAVMPVADAGKAGASSIGTAGAMLAVLDALGRGSAIVLLFGVLAVTTEFRQDTVTVTFLHIPRRLPVLAAKAATVVLLGAALAVVDLAVVLTIGLPTGAVPPSLLNGDVLLRVLGLLLAYPLYGLLGVAFGALLIYQPLAVVLPLTWLLFVEDLVLRFVPHALSSWSLHGATAALANEPDLKDVLPVPVGGLVLCGYVALLLALGAYRVVRRDIT